LFFFFKTAPRHHATRRNRPREITTSCWDRKKNDKDKAIGRCWNIITPPPPLFIFGMSPPLYQLCGCVLSNDALNCPSNQLDKSFAP
jgi:hypothetical protein